VVIEGTLVYLTSSTMSYNSQQLQHLDSETRRLCRRYVDEVVLRYSLCPWAEPALRGNRIQTHIITEVFSKKHGLEEAAQRVFSVMKEESESSFELLFILLPRAALSRLEMDDLLRAVRALQRPKDVVRADRHREEAPFALASFHPNADIDANTPERLIPFLRRSPDPMIQAVRNSVLAKIDPDRGSGTSFFDVTKLGMENIGRPPAEPLRLRVARANLKTCEETGFDLLEKTIRALKQDRDESRARIDAMDQPLP
jgi:hypothetical protein